MLDIDTEAIIGIAFQVALIKLLCLRHETRQFGLRFRLFSAVMARLSCS